MSNGLLQRAKAWLVGPASSDLTATAFLTSGQTVSRVAVDQYTALNLSAVYAAITVIANGVGTLPIHLYVPKPDGTRERDTSSNLAWLLKERPNPGMSITSFVKAIIAHAVSWGNGYAEIERGERGEIKALWLIPPNRVSVYLDNNDVPFYMFTARDGKVYRLERDEVLHVPGLGFNGVVGYSVVTLARETIGSGLAAEQYGASMLGNGALPAGVIMAKGALNPERTKAIKAAWESTHGGSVNAGRVAVMEAANFEFKPLSMSPQDTQFLETRQFSVLEIARWFGLPPSKLGDYRQAKFANLEQDQISFLNHSLLPWITAFEQELNHKLVPRGPRYFKMNLDVLLRPDTLSRLRAHEIAIRNGVMTIDEARKLEDLNPVPDGLGSMHLMPANTMVLGQRPESGSDNVPDEEPPDDEPNPDEDEPGEEDDDLRAVVAEYTLHFADIVQRSVAMQRKAVAAKRSVDDRAFASWCSEFYRGQHRTALAGWSRNAVSAMVQRMAGRTLRSTDLTAVDAVSADFARGLADDSMAAVSADRTAADGWDVSYCAARGEAAAEAAADSIRRILDGHN